MGKIITTLLIGGVVAGGAYYYSQSKQKGADILINLQGESQDGSFYTLAFSSQGCSVLERGGAEYLGDATAEDLSINCGITDKSKITPEQFACAVDLCGTPNREAGCNVRFSSKAGGCITSGCEIADGVYPMSSSQYQTVLDQCSANINSDLMLECRAEACSNTSIIVDDSSPVSTPQKKSIFQR